MCCHNKAIKKGLTGYISSNAIEDKSMYSTKKEEKRNGKEEILPLN